METSGYLMRSDETNRYPAVEVRFGPEEGGGEEFFRGAYASHVANPRYVQHERRIKEVMPCFDPTDVSSLPLGSVYTWVTRTMRPVMQRSMKPRLTGELEIVNAALTDSGFYRCVVSSTLSSIRLIFERPLVVYGIPVYCVLRDLIFRTARMDAVLARQVYGLVQFSFCRGDHVGCPFSFRDKGFDGRAGFYYYTIEMVQRLDPLYRQPKCDPSCIRQSATSHLLHGSLREQAFDNFRWRTVEKIRSLTKFLFEQRRNASWTRASCAEGFFLWKELICLPCLPGRYGRRGACLECGYAYYQSRFAAKSCRQCPKLGFSFDRAKTQPDECVPIGRNRIGLASLATAGAFACLLIWVCALHWGLLPCLYRPDARAGRPTFRDGRYLETLEAHRRKALRVKKILMKAKKMENDIVESFAAKKARRIRREREALAFVRSRASAELGLNHPGTSHDRIRESESRPLPPPRGPSKSEGRTIPELPKEVFVAERGL